MFPRSDVQRRISLTSVLPLILFAAAVAPAIADEGAAQICELIIKKGDIEKDLNREETRSFAACISEVSSEQKKCMTRFSEAIKGVNNATKEGLLKTLEESKKTGVCATDVSIGVVKKYYK